MFKTAPDDPQRVKFAVAMTRWAAIGTFVFFVLFGLFIDDIPTPSVFSGMLFGGFFLYMARGLSRSTKRLYLTLTVSLLIMGAMAVGVIADAIEGFAKSSDIFQCSDMMALSGIWAFSLWHARKAIPVQLAAQARGFEPIFSQPPPLQSSTDGRTIPDMADFIKAYIDEHATTAKLVAQELGPKIEAVGKILCDAFSGGKKVLTFGNGGSAADAQHLAEEMIGRFQRNRRPLPAISLNSDGTALTCIANDYGFDEIFARQVTALANPGDVVIGLSTSGNSPNVLKALQAGKTKSAITVALLGRGGGKIAPHCDHPLIVPGAQTANAVQEMHVMMVHLLCEIVDRWAEKT